MLVFVRMYPRNVATKTEKILHNVRLILEQGIQANTLCGAVVCISFFVITSLYKMHVTSDLLVPTKVQPVKNVSVLFLKGYSLLYDRNGAIRNLSIDTFLPIANLAPIDEFKSKLLCSKVVFLIPLRTIEIQTRIQLIETALFNMSCFTADTRFVVGWRSFIFFHPWSNRMKHYTKTLFEIWVFDFFQKFWLNQRVVEKFTKVVGRPIAEFIKLREAMPIFVIGLSFLLAAIAVFFIEYRNRVIQVSRLVLATFKSKNERIGNEQC